MSVYFRDVYLPLPCLEGSTTVGDAFTAPSVETYALNGYMLQTGLET